MRRGDPSEGFDAADDVGDGRWSSSEPYPLDAENDQNLYTEINIERFGFCRNG